MSELSPRARELLESARRAPCAPDEEQIARMERAVLVATTGTLAGLLGVKLASSSLAGKSAMAAVMVAVVGTTAAVTVAVLPADFGRRRAAAPVTAVPVKKVASKKSAPKEPVAPPLPVVEPEPAPEVQKVVEPAPPPRAVERVKPVAAPVIAPVPAPTAPPLPPPSAASSLAAELELLRAAKAEVDAGRWEAALEAIARHDAEFPEGALKLEADVLRVLAWCGQGRTGDAMERANQLRTRSPNSPAISRLAGSCVDL